MRYVMLLAVVCGCSASGGNPELAEMESVFRTGPIPYPDNYPGNGDLALYEGRSTASEDCLIYTTVGTDVQAGGASAPTVMRVVGGDILDPATNEVVCSRHGNELIEHVREGDDGPVLFTVMGRWVFDGEIDGLGKSWNDVVDQFDAQLLYTFQGARIYEHAVEMNHVLATATYPIAQAKPIRKLVLSAAIAGECGGLGLYADETADVHDEW